MNATRTLAALLLSLVELSAYALAANVVKMVITKSNPVVYDLSRDLTNDIHARATITETLFNNYTGGTAYIANVKVGSPGQELLLLIDTGSSDTFVLAINDDQCTDSDVMSIYGPCFGGTCGSYLETLLS
jgi:hypothetical protein